MNQVTINQAYLFLVFILNGILIGVIFDIFRILRRSFNTPNIITYIEDAIFWTLSALSVLYTLFVFNNGEIRGYIFIGLFLGIIVYMLFFSKTIIKVSVNILLFLKRIVCSVLKIIVYPIKVVFAFIQNTFIVPAKYLYKKSQIITQKYNKMKNKHKNKENLENKEGF